jgi:hypothetical protein
VEGVDVNNLEKLAKGAYWGPPSSDEQADPYRVLDGRSARRAGRDQQLATNVSKDFKDWMKSEAAKQGKSQAALLEDGRAAYLQVCGAGNE